MEIVLMGNWKAVVEIGLTLQILHTILGVPNKQMGQIHIVMLVFQVREAVIRVVLEFVVLGPLQMFVVQILVCREVLQQARKLQSLCYNICMSKLITQDPKILGGKPIIAGTRMSVETILELLSSGLSNKELVKEYPFLKEEHIKAALDYAAKIVAKEESYIFDKSRTAHEISR